MVSLEAGRLWFVAGGERTDITDLVDEDTPYVHTYTDGEGCSTISWWGAPRRTTAGLKG